MMSDNECVDREFEKAEEKEKHQKHKTKTKYKKFHKFIVKLSSLMLDLNVEPGCKCKDVVSEMYDLIYDEDWVPSYFHQY